MNVKYDIFKNFCITECKNADEEGVMVGSISCSQCKDFLGNDAKSQIVQCSHTDAKTDAKEE